jgi:hypothetical protein
MVSGAPYPEENPMKRKTYKIGLGLLCLVLLAGIGYTLVAAQDGVQADKKVFIPVLYRGPAGNQTITGKVLSQQNVPIQGVTITTNQGQSAVTDQNGNYSLVSLEEGTYTLTPSKENIAFSPGNSSVVVPPDVKMLNFTAQVSCSEAIINGGFENDSGWEFPVTEYTASYTNSEWHSGYRSARTGIVVPGDNRYSYSSTRQKVTIPSGTTSAYLTFWIKPYSEQVKGLSMPAMPAIGTQADQSPLSTDVQYVLVLDTNFNVINTLVWQISDTRTWTQYQFNLSGYAGRTVYLHFGTYNDGLDGISSMFVDDVSLEICPGGSPTPPPPTPGPCGNLVKNSGFESSSDWEIPLTAYPAGYSTSLAHSGSRSMRTGILNTNENKYSYSDFRQRLTIPYGTPVAKASFWLYTLSGEVKNLSQPEMITPTGRPFNETPLSGDVQYVLVLDQNQNWIDTLVWQRTDEGYWHYYEFDLRRYAGYTIYLQFGTYNDGYNGISNMHVDDAALDTCTATPTPGPSPTPSPTTTPAPCQELIINNNFEGGNGWEILNTHYPAAYSNAQYHSAFRSMRTGITDPAQNTYSYSDFRQWVTIPSTAHHVTLSMWLLPYSNESVLGILPEPIRTEHFGEEPMASDAQYVLILDQYQNWIGTLVWMRSNGSWTNMQFDLSSYAGWTIILQWGTYNNGTGGITSMYVDDVSLQACP